MWINAMKRYNGQMDEPNLINMIKIMTQMLYKDVNPINSGFDSKWISEIFKSIKMYRKETRVKVIQGILTP